MALDLRMKNGFRAISFEYLGVLDSYFIHRYIIIKYRSSSITDKIHRLLSKLWPFVNDNALFMGIWQKRGHPCPMDTFLVCSIVLCCCCVDVFFWHFGVVCLLFGVDLLFHCGKPRRNPEVRLFEWFH